MPGKTRTLNRPQIVHQMKETNVNWVTTKCGINGKKGALMTTAWHTEVTCKECSP